jgi:hypothetical protein
VTDLRHERSACRPIGHDGMTVAEREIMALFDQGAGVANIAFITGQSPTTISTIISRLAVTALEPWKVDAAQGSAALAAALSARFPDRCGAAS